MKTLRIIDVETLSKHLTDEHFLRLAKQAPREMARSITEGPLTSDRWIYRLVVIFLGVVAMTSLVGGVVLTWLLPNWAMPQMLVALGSTAVGALAGLLAPPPVTAEILSAAPSHPSPCVPVSGVPRPHPGPPR